MSAKRKTIVGVIFGGRSVEHDVSIVTGQQVMMAFNPEQYEVVPIYITRDGKWLTGSPLKDIHNYREDITRHKEVEPAILSPSVQQHGLIINPLPGRFQKSIVRRLDVVFPAIHGSHGEDGSLQGLLEMADIPYVGCGVLSSALANDKALVKRVLRENNIPVLDDIVFSRAEWLEDRAAILARIKATFAYPVFVKPVTLGSSIGVARVDSDDLLAISIDMAASFDRRVLIEPAVMGGVEINCAVMGQGRHIETSVLEQPVSWQEFLTYEEKYLRGGGGMKGAERIIPAPISDELAAQIRNYAVAAFQAIDGRGIARVDFLVKGHTNADGKPVEIYLEELNTMPGSLAFYLWEEAGMTPGDVVHKLVKLAQDAHAEKRRNLYDYQTGLVELTATRGLKGVKGVKGGGAKSR